MTPRWLLLPLILLVLPISAAANSVVPVTSNKSIPSRQCQKPALSRLIRHKVAPGETLDSIAQRYNLIPATLIGMNPALQNGQVPVGREIIIPPYNGIRVQVPVNQTWRNVAAKYKVRADVLFEVNGCQKAPSVVFVPGVNWSPQPPPSSNQLRGYPLPLKTNIALGYGWQIHPRTGKVFFHSGLDLVAAAGTQVRAVAAGTVAFADNQGSYGNLVVVNHQGGRQTRYAHLQKIVVTAGQKVIKGEVLGRVGATGEPTSRQLHLHYELRYSSSLGWVAEDPVSLLKP